MQLQVVKILGRIPTVKELLYATAAKEYFGVVDRPYYHSTGHISDPITQNYPSPTASEVGREALGRAISYFCEGAISTCSGEGLYRFLSGYEPWCGKAPAPAGVGGRVEIKDRQRPGGHAAGGGWGGRSFMVCASEGR
jgi:hypothetical protein